LRSFQVRHAAWRGDDVSVTRRWRLGERRSGKRTRPPRSCPACMLHGV